MKRRTGAVALLAMLCLPVSANADVITETLTTPALPTTAFSSGSIGLLTNPFNQFDPSLGTLNAQQPRQCAFIWRSRFVRQNSLYPWPTVRPPELRAAVREGTD